MLIIYERQPVQSAMGLKVCTCIYWRTSFGQRKTTNNHFVGGSLGYKSKIKALKRKNRDKQSDDNFG